MHGEGAYGLWGLVILNATIFIVFAFSFFKPETKRDWRTFSTFSAFVVALFVEMYGFPLTIYVLSGWLQGAFPESQLLGSHDSGHLWHSVLGLEGNPHTHPVHLLSNILVVVGFILLASSWRVLYAAQKEGRLATTGTYALVRHPQYVAFATIMLGFLIQWPTILTLAMFPVLVLMYGRLSLTEERDSAERFGEAWESYAARTPRYLPKLGARRNDEGDTDTRESFEDAGAA